MPNDTKRNQDPQDGATLHEDDPIPAASDEKVLEETARLAREGRKQLESDPKESRPGSE
ncbi:hypothetical protein [Ramlibacter alkalitolerans]|jgi:hypothetical protein|uniref:Uncharacterized protein n=1 Tax=Ramlibacter alkalitolerans TaxID=2039631 RepID=A0ABS1JQI6_9BURK|nr:hypothetical protein [Ramlibacter alkalitolerans]MBL0426512.1 hypothetical protein [Ramlibacter alkalitolerans]